MIRVVEGVGVGPTDQAAFDAALVDAGVGRYNLLRYSSVIPAHATVEPVSTMPPMGEVGERLPAVVARSVAPADEPAAAGLAWARVASGEGILYEASAAGENAESSVEADLSRGIDHALALRGWEATTRDRRVLVAAPADGVAQCAAVLATFGEPEPAVPR